MAPCWNRDIPDSIPTQTMSEMYLQFQPQAPTPGAAPRPPNWASVEHLCRDHSKVLTCGVWPPPMAPRIPSLREASPAPWQPGSFPAGGSVFRHGESELGRGILVLLVLLQHLLTILFYGISRWSWLWKPVPLEHGFHLLTDHKGSKKARLLVHVYYVTVTDRDKNPVVPFQLKHTTLVDGVKSVFCLFRPAACSCTFHEQNGLWVISQLVNILDELLGVSDLCQQTRILILIFTEAKVNLWVDVIIPRLRYHQLAIPQLHIVKERVAFPWRFPVAYFMSGASLGWGIYLRKKKREGKLRAWGWWSLVSAVNTQVRKPALPSGSQQQVTSSILSKQLEVQK